MPLMIFKATLEGGHKELRRACLSTPCPTCRRTTTVSLAPSPVRHDPAFPMAVPLRALPLWGPVPLCAPAPAWVSAALSRGQWL